MPRILVLLLTLILALLAPAPALAQTPSGTPGSIANLRIDLWPEYDREDVLVIYHLNLGPGISLPAQLTLRIPTAAGEPYNVAVREADGQLYNLSYQREVVGEWAEINFTTTSPEVQFEYYDPALARETAQRAFTYRWPGDYPVDALTIQVQQPVGAEQMRISPSLGSPARGANDLLIYQALVGQIPPNTPFEVSLEYQKADDSLSVEALQVQPSAPVNSQTAGRNTIDQMLPWVIGGVGLLLLVGGSVFWWWSSGRQRAAQPIRRRHAGRPERSAGSAPAGSVFCHQCGRKAGAEDLFCRSCGTRLRREGDRS